MKKRVLSGIQPTGEIHIGNYLGALVQWKELMQDHECFYIIVDLHALTIPFNPKEMPQRIRDTAIALIASGIDPERAVLFVQSSVPQHTELCWIFNTITPLGMLFRMTQFKEKSRGAIWKEALKDTKRLEHIKRELKKIVDDLETEYNKLKELSLKLETVEEVQKLNEELGIVMQMLHVGLGISEVSTGLLDYPVLQAADILLYKAEVIPVGEDQKQHIELTREIALRFNNLIGEEFFPLPIAKIKYDTKRILGLDGKSKMSKSLGNYIGILEDRESIWEKLKTAYTDPARVTRHDPGHPEICNIFTIHQGFTPPTTISQIEEECRTAKIGCFQCKKLLLDSMVAHFAPVREKAERLYNQPKLLDEILHEGANKAKGVALDTMEKVKEKLGLRF